MALRTIGVRLTADVRDYMRGLRDAHAGTKMLGSEMDDTAGAGLKAAASADLLGGKLRDLAGDARRLDVDISRSTGSLRDLARQITATEDAAKRADLWKALRLEKRKQRELISLRSLIDVDSAAGVGGELAEKASVSFMARFGPLLARAPMSGMHPAGLAIGAPLALGAAATVSGALSAAVVGAATGGGILGGVAIASRHPAVKAAAAATGSEFGEALQRAGGSFVPATLASLGLVRGRIGDIEDDLTRAFSASARFLPRLTDRFLDGAEDAVDGFADSVENAGPVMEAFGIIGERSLRFVGDTLRRLSEEAPEASRALLVLWHTFEGGARALVETIALLAETYGWMERVGLLMTGNARRAFELAVQEELAKRKSDELSPSLKALIEGFTGSGDAAANAAAEVLTLSGRLDRLLSSVLGVEQAHSAFEEAIDRATEAAKTNGDGIDRSIPKQRANRDALFGIAEAALRAAQAELEHGGGTAAAAAVAERGRKKFLEVAHSMGVEKGEAERLANALFGIPNVERDVKADTGPARGQVAAYKRWLASQNLDKTSTIRVREIREQRTARGGPREFSNRWGGIYTPAADGLLRQAHIASPVWPARYAYAEPATGGEAFVPRYGDRDRSLAILDEAARWYGASVWAPGTGPAGEVAPHATRAPEWTTRDAAGGPAGGVAGGAAGLVTELQGVRAEIRALRRDVEVGAVAAGRAFGRELGNAEERALTEARLR